MKPAFFPKLALSGIKKNSKTYTPFILSAIGCISMFYIMISLANEKGLEDISGGMVAQSMLMMGSIVVGLFSLIFIFYTNSFLIKRRKKELGLYNVLGMGKIHIMRMIFWETLFICLFSMIVGILIGVLLNRLLLVLLLKILGVAVVFTMGFSLDCIIFTSISFGLVFALNLFVNMFRVGVNKPIELLNGGKKGEKEPKTNIPVALIGFLTLGAGYYIAQTVKDPIVALVQFFIAVILVIIGTFCLVTAGSTVFLKLLKKNKKYYYKTSHFINVSTMIYRMKQNAAGIASICILSTMVLVTVSTTFCLYFGIGDTVEESFLSDALINVKNGDKIRAEEFIVDSLNEAGVKEYDNYSMKSYYNYNFVLKDENNLVTNQNEYSYSNYIYLTMTAKDLISQGLITEIGENEVLLYTKIGFDQETIVISGKEYNVISPDNDLDLKIFQNSLGMSNPMIIVFSNQDILEDVLDNYNRDMFFDSYDIAILTDETEKLNKALSIMDDKQDDSFSYRSWTKEGLFAEGKSLYGSFIFLGIFLGLLFLMATTLIMYYKQISEGYDDKERFNILEKVGMSQEEIKKTIKSQVLMIFFVPLILAIIHALFAFKMINVIMTAFSVGVLSTFIFYTAATIAVFILVYVVVYALTARTYYKIVK